MPFAVDRLEHRPVVGQQPDLAGDGADRGAALRNDGAGHAVERDRFRQRRGQAMQPAGPRRQRPAARLARAQRQLHRLALGDLLVGARALRLGLGPGAQRVLVLPGAIERLRGPRRERIEVFAVLGR